MYYFLLFSVAVITGIGIAHANWGSFLYKFAAAIIAAYVIYKLDDIIKRR